MAAECAEVGDSASETETEDENFEPELSFVADENVREIILSKTSARMGITFPPPAVEEKENKEPIIKKPEHEVHNLLKARVLPNEDNTGQAIFGFKTPKRRDALSKAAQSSVHSSKKSSKKSINNGTPGPNKSKWNDQNKSKPSKRTPLYVEEDASSDDDDGNEDDVGEQSDESDDEEEKLQTDGTKLLHGNDILDQYFEIHSSKYKQATSDKTLATLHNPKLQQQELITHLKEVQTSHIPETASLIRSHSGHFQRWMFQLLNGFNVLLYGLGSKHKLIEEFRKKHLKNEVHLVINGFFPSITIKQIVNIICDDILNDKLTFRHVTDQANHIKSQYDREHSEKLFLIVHNVDGHMIRSKNAQSVLACLASSENIHVIASIDHINAPLIWDQNLSSTYNWLWFDCTTYEPYAEETSYENSLMVQQSGTLALSSLIHVLRSLTPNAKGIFQLLVDCQLDNENNSSYQGLSFSNLYNRCRERFLVNSDLTLRAQLTEFKDHKLIKTKKAANGLEYLSVALDCSTLRQFLEHEEG